MDATMSAYLAEPLTETVPGRRTLHGERGKPLRLFDKNGYPLTDYDGHPLVNISGRMLLQLNGNETEIQDLRGFPPTDYLGRPPSDLRFDPEGTPKTDFPTTPILNRNGQRQIIFSLLGWPLTDTNGRPLSDSSGKCLVVSDDDGVPVSDLDGHQIINLPCFNVESSTDLPLLDKISGLVLHIYDEYGRPLTNSDGFVLADIFGEPLVILDDHENAVGTCYGSDIYDSEKRCKSNRLYEPTKQSSNRQLLAPVLDADGNALLLFDRTGFPLTDSYGHPLVDSNGLTLIEYDGELNKITCRGLDTIQIIAGLYNPDSFKSIYNDLGVPARLFNFQGKPLTNWLGEPMKHADGILLIKFDSRGKPKCDFQGLPIYDEYGAVVSDCSSTPFDVLTYSGQVPFFRDSDPARSGIKLFDSSGMPVTDHRGFCLTNTWRNYMLVKDSIQKKITDNEGEAIFTGCGLPLINSLSEPILNPRREICQLFDNEGNPLTCKRGYPLRLPSGGYSIEIDDIGRIVGDSNGRPVYDFMGVPMTSFIKFEASELAKNANRVSSSSSAVLKTNERMARSGIRLLDSSAMPVTDHREFCLTNASRKYMLIKDSLQKKTTDNEGETIFTEGGLPLINSLSEPVLNPKRNISQLFHNRGNPLTCKSGNPLRLTSGGYSIEIGDIGRIVGDSNGITVYDITGVPMTPFIKFNASKLAKNAKRTSSSSSAALKKNELMFKSMSDLLVNEKDVLQKQIFKRDTVSQNCSFKLGATSSHLSVNATFLRDYYNERFFSNGSNFKPDGTQQEELPSKYEENFNFNSYFENIKEKEVESDSKLFIDESVPSVDRSEEILETHDGRLALEFDSDDKLDYRCRDIYDGDGLPLTNVTGCWKNKEGIPLRIFNKCGHPLTDAGGKSLLDIKGVSLVGRDEIGRPLLDSNGNAVFDADGIASGEYKFSPIKQPIHDGLCPLLDADEKPVRIFDSEGRPLNDENGEILANSSGTNLLRFDNLGPDSMVDLSGNKVYDSQGIPMGYRPDTPLINISGSPLRLFDANGRPLTDFSGFPLITASGECLIDFDLYGRPHRCSEGKNLYDCGGRILGSLGFQPEAPHLIATNRLEKNHYGPLKVYDGNDKPLTDRFGNILVNWKGDELIFIESEIPICDIDGYSLFDEGGNDLLIEPYTFVLLLNH